MTTAGGAAHSTRYLSFSYRGVLQLRQVLQGGYLLLSNDRGTPARTQMNVARWTGRRGIARKRETDDSKAIYAPPFTLWKGDVGAGCGGRG